MKKIVYLSIIVVAITACSKHDDPVVPPKGETKPVVSTLVLTPASTSLTVQCTISGMTSGSLSYDTIQNSQGNKITLGGEDGSVSQTITGLVPEKTYFVTVTATNKYGTTTASSSGNTLASLPAVTNGTFTASTPFAGTFSWNVTAGGSQVSSGITLTWYNEMTGNGSLSVPTGTGTGSFSYTKTDLIPGTVYHVRIYAQNSAGTSYGAEDSVVTPGFHKGQLKDGGIVFWASADAKKALVAAKTDFAPGTVFAYWYSLGPYPFIGATFNDFGNGDLNTAIIANYPGCPDSSAGKIAYNHSTVDGYSGYYLPNSTEMHELIVQGNNIPGLAGTFVMVSAQIWNMYWCSNEYGPDAAILAYTQNVSIYAQPSTIAKGGGGGIRLIKKVGNW